MAELKVELDNARLGLLSGMKKAIPIVLGYVPVSFAFGVLATGVGMSALDALIMGAMFLAGSGQLIAVSMLGNGDAFSAIVITSTVVNLRHLLKSAAMIPGLSRWPRWRKALFAFELTDETFAMHADRFAHMANVPEKLTRKYYIAETFGINVTSHFSWIMGGFLGAAFGNVIGDLRTYGLDYALPGMFVALLAPRLFNRPELIVSIVAGVSSVALVLVGLDAWNLILATIIGATVGVFLPRSRKKRDNAENQES
ncbi:MAG: AzlC family ABC transporter permease [Desulfovibrionaceae bacterium]|nr:AzlC family ABC transporter permease [Desulfovibrionaceae bacterium]